MINISNKQEVFHYEKENIYTNTHGGIDHDEHHNFCD